MSNILLKLKAWRQERADLEKIEPWRVISHAAVEEIAKLMPRTREQLLEVKGIKEKKFEKYGAQILAIVGEAAGDDLLNANLLSFPRMRESRINTDWIPDQVGNDKNTGEKIFTVSMFLDLINIGLRTSEAKIRGEVSSCDFRGNYLFFTLKDKADGSSISCFMWQREYQMSGVVIAEGMEIIVHGFPEIYKPSGRLSFKGDSIELVGEGALKKAYDELHKKLEREGLFAIERKRAVPEYVQKIGLITSRTGAVIHDFLNNIGKFGYHIQFIDSHVEGQLAVADLLAAVRSFRKKDIDVLVLIRGGGSLESLLPFNNEMLVREISQFPKPVVCGIGHDKDITLAALAADIAVSTPTAVTRVLNSSWEQALGHVRLAEQEIFGAYRETLLRKRHLLGMYSQDIREGFLLILARLRAVEQNIKDGMIRIGYEVKSMMRRVQERSDSLPKYLSLALHAVAEELVRSEKAIALHNPERQLKLGYSIARVGRKIIRSVTDVQPGDLLDLMVADGMIGTEVSSFAKASED